MFIDTIQKQNDHPYHISEIKNRILARVQNLTNSNERLFLNMLIATFTFKTNQLISFSDFLPSFSPTTLGLSMKLPKTFCFLFTHWNNTLRRQKNICYVKTKTQSQTWNQNTRIQQTFQ